MQGIYRVRNKINDKRYIGSTNDFEKGWKSRCQVLRRGNYHNIHLQRAWNKYGEENFVFEIEEEVAGDNRALLAREQVYLDEWFPTGLLYNVAIIVGGGAVRGKGWHQTEETLTKISKAKKGCVAWNKGKTCPQLCGENNGMYGKTGEANHLYGKARSEENKANLCASWTEERKAEQSERSKKMWTEERKAEQGKRYSGEGNPNYGNTGKNNPLYGKKRPEEVRAAIGKANSKSYPTFYNVLTGQAILAGKNLSKLCRELGLNLGAMRMVARSHNKRTRDGWCLAADGGTNCE